MANTKKSGSVTNKSQGRPKQGQKGTQSRAKQTVQNKNTKAKNTRNGQMYIEREKAENQRRQVNALALFFVSLFTFAVTVIPGGNIWGTLRDVLFGLFGVCAFVWPLILLYLAIMLSLDKPVGNTRTKVIEASVLTLFICSAVHIFSGEVPVVDYIGDITEAFRLGLVTSNGGAFGAIIGGGLLYLFASKAAAGVTIILLILVFILLITGTTLISFIDGMTKPVKKVKDDAAEQLEISAQMLKEKREQREAQKSFNPDVDLGPEAALSRDVFADDDTPKRKRKEKTPTAEEAAAFAGTFGTETVEAMAKEAENAKNLSTLEQTEPKPSVLLDDIIKKAANKNASQTAQSSEEKKEELEKPTLAAHDETESTEYKFPPYSLLSPPKLNLSGNSENEMRENADKLISALRSFGVETSLVDICRGPSVTRYELAPAQGVRINKITGLADDIALSLAATSIRIEAPIPGKAAVGIEIPNTGRDSITLRELLESKEYKERVKKSKLTVALGRGITGDIETMDISKMPHILLAGTTGSGKSVCMNSMILSLLYNASPDEVKLVMIDPKSVELTGYNGIPHMLIPVVTDPKKASGALAWAVKEMLNRYKSFSENNVRDIKGYNELSKMDPDKKPMPHIVIFIDEFADLMMAAAKDVEDSVCRLAQMARAAGMHLVIATQSPRVDVITGLIKANIPSRMALKVSNGTDSRIILDMMGAEKLLGKGDMLFNPVGASNPIRIQGCKVLDKEISDVIEFVKNQGETTYNEAVLEEIDKHAAASDSGSKSSGTVNEPSGGDDGDELLPEAIKVVVEAGKASTTLMQTKLKVGYARAARLVDELEERGVIGPFEGSKPRRVLITKEQWLEMNALSNNSAEAIAMDSVAENQMEF